MPNIRFLSQPLFRKATRTKQVIGHIQPTSAIITMPAISDKRVKFCCEVFSALQRLNRNLFHISEVCTNGTVLLFVEDYLQRSCSVLQQAKRYLQL